MMNVHVFNSLNIDNKRQLHAFKIANLDIGSRKTF